MDKKKIIIIGVVLVAVVVGLLLLFSIKHEVTFNSMGGSEIKSQTIKMFGKVEEPEDPTREGYTFDAWYYEDEVYDFDTSVTKDMELIARWISNDANEQKKTFTITFDSKGGSEVASIEVEENGTITKPEDPTREGYNFVYWQYNGKEWNFSTKVTQNMTLTAKWQKSTSTSDNETTEKVAVTGLKLSDSSLDLKLGESKKVTATITPSNATNKTVTWKSSDTSVATVKNGTITAVGMGTATITATVGGKTATVKVTVTASITDYKAEWVPVANSTMGQETLYIKAPNGSYVAGKVKITTAAGKESEVSIPASGKMYIRSAITNVTVTSID